MPAYHYAATFCWGRNLTDPPVRSVPKWSRNGTMQFNVAILRYSYIFWLAGWLALLWTKSPLVRPSLQRLPQPQWRSIVVDNSNKFHFSCLQEGQIIIISREFFGAKEFCQGEIEGCWRSNLDISAVHWHDRNYIDEEERIHQPVCRPNNLARIHSLGLINLTRRNKWRSNDRRKEIPVACQMIPKSK